MDHIDIFPDTNIFLHYPPLAAIDWKSLTGKSEVRLVLCLQVIDELDEKKSHPLLSGRAKRAITEIRAAKAKRIEIRPGITVEVFKYDPEDQSSGDRRIVQLIQEYKRKNPARNVAILTEDGGMEMRCETAGVQVIMMDSSIREPDLQDEFSKKHNLVASELAAFKNRQPKLSVFATKVGAESDGKRPSTFEITPTSFQWANVDVQMEVVNKSVPKYNMRVEQPAGATLNPGLAKAMEQLSRVGDGDKEEYNRDVDKYLIDYKNYLAYANYAGAIKSICFELDLVIANGGTLRRYPFFPRKK
jgi:rRNA-processing protein FCF1